MKYMIVIVLCLFSLTRTYSQNSGTRNSDPGKVQFVTNDISRFWAAYDLAKSSDKNSIAIYDSLYFTAGSPGLKAFKGVSIKTTENFVKAIEKYRLYYESIRPNTYKIDQFKPIMYKSLLEFKKLYPKAVFPDVYFLIGDLNAGGKPVDEGLLIGTEVYSADSNSDFTGIYPPFVKVLRSQTTANIPDVVLHELVHYQQNDAAGSNTVLSYSIKEGSADFISELILGKSNNKVAFTYGEKHEKELWNAFRKDLNSPDINKWFYNSAVDDRPADLGYYMGFKITESYYHNAKNKQEAIDQILNTQDFDSFLEASKYGEKFK